MRYIFSVGKNELPVYVAAKALLKPDDQALFVHSSDSAKEVGRIQKLLCHPNPAITVPIEDAYEPASIRRKLSTLTKPGEHPHFHYSGGTKAMIVEIARRLPPSTTLSYLDPSEHRIRQWPFEEKESFDQRRNIALSLKQLVELHDYVLANTSIPSGQVLHREMCGRPPVHHPGRPLEWWTYQSLCQALRDLRLAFNVHWSVKPTTQNGREMEIDVATVIGYQFVGISCANLGQSNRDRCKDKAFEIWHRTRQLGGDVARAILVCKLDTDHSKDLEREVRQELGPSADSFQVWGNDLLCHDAPETALRSKFREYLTALLRDPDPCKESPAPAFIGKDRSMEHILLTVGTNEMAVLAAADRLYRDSLESGNTPVITLVSSDRVESARIRQALRERIAGIRFTQPLIVSAYLPGDISAAVDRYRDALCPEDTLRVDYTGGTKAMVVHAVAELSTRTNRFSYLDVRKRHLHGCGSGDLRSGWELDVASLAKIHGYEARGIGGTVTGLRKITPLTEDSWLTWTTNSNIRKRIPWPADWAAAGFELKAGCGFDDETWSMGAEQVVNFARISPDFPRLHSINLALQSTGLKLDVYDALRAALVGRRPASVVHSVSVNGRAEIEIVAVLGYEPLVVGCVDQAPVPGKSYPALCKRRGFELLYRARQIGGDQVHAALITRGSSGHVSDILEDMAVDSGYTEPVQVWGASDLGVLGGKFAILLDSLKWGRI